jgi:hypothetical protein
LPYKSSNKYMYVSSSRLSLEKYSSLSDVDSLARIQTLDSLYPVLRYLSLSFKIKGLALSVHLVVYLRKIEVGDPLTPCPYIFLQTQISVFRTVFSYPKSEFSSVQNRFGTNQISVCANSKNPTLFFGVPPPPPGTIFSVQNIV